MPSIVHLHLDGDGCWPDLKDPKLLMESGKLTWLGDGTSIDIAALSAGMQSGRTSLAIRIDLPDGRIVVAEVSLRNMQIAIAAFTARLGDQT